MKQLLIFLISFSCLTSLFANNYGNEWIDPTKIYYKFDISEEGLYRIPYNVLDNANVNMQADGFKLFFDGEEVPIYVSDAANFGSGDYIEFYADKLRGDFDTQLFKDPEYQLHKNMSLFTDTATYFLTVDVTTNNLRINDVNNNIANTPPAKEYFIHKSVYFTNQSFFNGIGRRFSGVNVYYPEYEEGEGFVGDVFAVGVPNISNTKEVLAYTPNIFNNGPAADIEFKIVGQSDDFFTSPDHILQVKINGDEVVYDQYEGYDVRKYNIDNYPLTSLSSPFTYVQFAALNFSSSADRNAVSYIDIDYPRDFDFSAVGDRFKFNVEATGDVTDYIEITNFPSGTAQPILYDMSNKMRLLGSINGNDVRYHLPIDAAQTRELFISQNSTSAITEITSLTQRTFINYDDVTKQGDYIIITHPSFRTGPDHVDSYADYRESYAGGEYDVVIADIEQLYDQFAHGIKKHPLAIKNYMEYATDTWDIVPENIFLIGKSIKNSKCRNNPITWPKNLVPTFGDTPSDLQFGIYDTLHTPHIAVGRLSATNQQQIFDYLDKVQEYESQTIVDCTEEALLWTKQVLHISGGNDLDQQISFNAYLDNYETIIEDTLYGGNVFRFYKQSSDPIQQTPDELMDSLLNDVGLGMVCFFGHANGLYWEVDVGSASQYANDGKYPFMMANSCFVGDIHKDFGDTGTLSMSEEWTMSPNSGAIAYLAAVQFGFPVALNIYTEEMYRQLSYKNYNKSIGSCMVNAVNEVYDTNYGVQITTEEMVLQGDPAIALNFVEKPEYAISNSDIFFNPPLVSTQIDSFQVNVIVTNLGTALPDSLDVVVERTFPDGTQSIVANKRFEAPEYQDTLSVKVYTDPLEGFGTNTITAYVDFNQEIDELCEDNNITTVNLFVASDNLVPVQPCNYSIVSETPITFKASTANAVIDEQTYIIQLDTTENFNSGFFNQTTEVSTGGIIEWTPGFNFSPNQEYYWRVAKFESGVTDLSWRYSSFIYQPGSLPGWNQSDYWQYLRGTKSENMNLNPNSREYEYQNNVKNIKVQTGFYGGQGGLSGNQYNDIYIDINNIREVTWSCLAECTDNYNGGIQLVVLNPATLNAEVSSIDSINFAGLNDPNCFMDAPCCDEFALGSFDNVHCSATDVPAFEFPTQTIDQLQKLIAFLDAIPDGYYVVSKSIQNHNLEYDPALASYLNIIYDYFNDMGVPEMSTLTASAPFLILSRKGMTDYTPQVQVSSNISDVLFLDVDITGKWVEGTYESVLVGPASDWTSMEYNDFTIDPALNNADNAVINVFGIRTNGIEEFLFSTANMDTSLANINAIFHPFLRLEYESNDFVYNTPPQLDNWTVYFDGVTELALNSSAAFSYTGDTLNFGETFDIEIAIENASGVASDSILVYYEVLDKNNETHLVATSLEAPLGPDSLVVTNASFDTSQFIGLNFLSVTLNPASNTTYWQREKFTFNNILVLPFFVRGDNVNPLVDVTFDGVHILDGDIVSAAPEIAITIHDESEYLALTDTSVAEITLIYPDGTEVVCGYEDTAVEFIPADVNNLQEENVAQVIINKEFPIDGVYTLSVEGRDMAGNLAGDLNYKISFEVINKSMISNLLNYPNPFSTSTQFMFTLTGSQMPDVLTIQILTTSGKVVKEIDMNELGNINIGRNLTDYRWDGTDQYGGTLANGVYLYRVITRMDNNELELYTNTELKTIDDAFSKSGIGKLYIMR